ELPDRRQLGPGREHPAGDHRGDLAADLLVRRGRAARVNLDDHLPCHVADPAVAGTAAGCCHGAVATNQPTAAATKTASVDMTPMTVATAESSGWAATVCTEMQKKTSASPPPESTCRARERMASSAAITSGSASGCGRRSTCHWMARTAPATASETTSQDTAVQSGWAWPAAAAQPVATATSTETVAVAGTSAQAVRPMYALGRRGRSAAARRGPCARCTTRTSATSAPRNQPAKIVTA